VLLQHIEHALHRLGDGVVAGEGVVLEQGIKDRFGDEVLGQHLDDFPSVMLSFRSSRSSLAKA
jgi:hypothetical protein